ncbi:putative ribonuclease H-like domain-containing protein [Tanacetum coccineum]
MDRKDGSCELQINQHVAKAENQLNKKVKGIRCDNGTEFKNAKLIELCGEKGIKRDYSNPRTPQQNGVAERKNRTLIEAARTMVSITNPHNKTPYELISGKVPQIGHLKPFGCQVTILNTSDHLGKFEGKADEGYLVGYAPNSKAYRVYNLTNKRVEETMNLRFLEDKPNVQGIGHEWYFDLDYLTDSLGYTRFKTDKPGRFLHQAMVLVLWNAIQISRRACYASKDPAGIDSAGGVSAGSTSAGSDPAGRFQPAGSYEPADRGNPAVSTSVSADFIPVHADESTLPPGQSLGSMPLLQNLALLSDTIAELKKSKVGVKVLSVDNSRSIKDQSYRPPSLRDATDHQPESMEYVPLPYGKHAIGTKWILKNKRDARGFGRIGQSGLFLALASYMGFLVYRWDVKECLFSMEKLKEESVKTCKSTPYEAAKTKLTDVSDPPVNVHLYRSMIGSLMYLTASRPDIMFAVSACSRHQVTPLTSHLNAVKKIFQVVSILGRRFNFMAVQKKAGLLLGLLLLQKPRSCWLASCCATGSQLWLVVYSSPADRLFCGIVYVFLLFDIVGWLESLPLVTLFRWYALTHAPPVVFDSLVKQFWATAVVRPNAVGSHDLVATIDGREGMRVIGYPTDGTLTFLKHHLSPQWRFLVHTLMHCLSPKSGSWNQFPRSTNPLTPPMLAIAAAGNDAAGDDDADNEDTAAVNEAAGNVAEAPLVPYSTLVSPVREPTPEQQPSPTIPET